MIKKIGIYGGTFSPPHIGHISAAKAFYDEIKPDTLLIMPTYLPPHKQMYDIGSAHRVAMSRLAFSEKNGFDTSVVISEYETEKRTTSYTYETLQHFAKDGSRLYFLCGTDMFLTLDKWRNPDIIFSLATLVLALRDDLTDSVKKEITDAKARYEKIFGASIIILENTPISISSSELREAILSGESISKYVTPEVEEYIKKNRLYLTENTDITEEFAVLQNEVASRISDPYRFEHTLSVAKECLRLADIFSLDSAEKRKLYIAALLHDVAKGLSFEEHKALDKKYSVGFTKDDYASPAVLHAKAGARIAEVDFPFYADKDICDAIACHTTGDENMSLISKLLFLADYIEPIRKWDVCKKTAADFYARLEKTSGNGIFDVLDRTILRVICDTEAHVRGKGLAVHPNSIKSKDFLLKTIE